MNNHLFETSLNFRKGNIKQFSHFYSEPEMVLDEVLRKFCNSWLKEEFYEQANIEHYKHSSERSDYGNGYYSRKLITSRSVIDLRVPRGRSHRYEYSLFKKYERRTPCFDDVVISSLILGHSTRKSERFFDNLLGEGTISHSLASNIFAKFDLEMAKWRTRRFEKKVKILFLDAVHLKGSITAYRYAKPVLFAYAVYEDGTEELLDYQVAQSESQQSWEGFCCSLYNRGIEDVDFIVRDDRGSIAASSSLFWGKAKQQYCVFHLLQNFTKYLKKTKIDKKERRRILDKTSELFKDVSSKKEFYKKFTKYMVLMKKYKNLRAFKYLICKIDGSIEYLDLPKEYHALAKTNNRLERTFKEVKRRIKTFGRFPNKLSCERWLYALIKHEMLPQYKGISVKKEFTQDS